MSHYQGQTAGSREVEARNPVVRQFIEGLRRLENGEGADSLLKLFSDDCKVGNMLLDEPMQGQNGAARFWKDYQDTFKKIESYFSRIEEGENSASLEWSSTGTLRTGHPITYRGASLLGLEDGKIAYFAAYFDSRHFIEHPHF